MKNGLLCIIAMVLILFDVNAQEKQRIDQQCDFKQGSIVIVYKNECIEYKFKSLDDLNEQIETIINEIDFSTIKNESCEVQLELKLEIAFDVINIQLSELIKTNCKGIALETAAKRLKAMLLAAAFG